MLKDQQAQSVIADKGDDADAIVAQTESLRATTVIPPKRSRKQRRDYDRDLYKKRNRIEGCFNKLKRFRCFATR